jgi:phosphoribosylamine--glycine ligase
VKRVLIVGSGGREHALAWACAGNRDDVELIVAPGNGGTARIAENVDVSATDASGIARLAREREVDLVIIGPDAAAAAGVADACSTVGVTVFGPTAAAARIESSKSFAKALMDQCGIPTARWVSGGSEDRVALERFVADVGGACVVKADGLALGKGVVVCASAEEAHAALDACLLGARYGDAGNRVVVEERLQGLEVSVLGLSDGRSVRVLPTARDHKRAFDGDRGPNTGGMGAVAPPPGIDDMFAEHVARTVLQPCIDALRARGTSFVGCLYAGVILTPEGLRVLEFNARFGDPEAQVMLPLLAEPALDLFTMAARGELEPGTVAAQERSAVGVVAAAAGYPGDVRTGDEISGLEDVDRDVLCFHAGTRLDAGGEFYTAGGRVLCVVALGKGMDDARRCAYENIGRVSFTGMHFRSDIGAAPAPSRSDPLGVTA